MTVSIGETQSLARETRRIGPARCLGSIYALRRGGNSTDEGELVHRGHLDARVSREPQQYRARSSGGQSAMPAVQEGGIRGDSLGEFAGEFRSVATELKRVARSGLVDQTYAHAPSRRIDVAAAQPKRLGDGYAMFGYEPSEQAI